MAFRLVFQYPEFQDQLLRALSEDSDQKRTDSKMNDFGDQNGEDDDAEDDRTPCRNYIYIVWNSRNLRYDFVYRTEKIKSRYHRGNSPRTMFKSNRLPSCRCILDNRLKWRYVFAGNDKPAYDMRISNGK